MSVAAPTVAQLIGARLRRLLAERGWTHEELSFRCRIAGEHIPAGTIGRWCRGEREPSQQHRAVIARVFGESPTEFLLRALSEGLAEGSADDPGYLNPSPAHAA